MKYLLSGILVFLFGFQSNDESVKAKINIEQKNDFTIFSAVCLNNCDNDLTANYLFRIKKKGKSGTSSNSQSGEIKMVSKQKKICSIVKLNLTKGDTCHINFEVNHKNINLDKENLVYVAK